MIPACVNESQRQPLRDDSVHTQFPVHIQLPVHVERMPFDVWTNLGSLRATACGHQGLLGHP